ncbi:MFS transporter [Nocardioides insulae]|uniref:MFS transporter n=1 Tax=Nocardioides insulae TaxID=394734 RepID=UPI0003F73D09|nr:MFS transporter [Nocardioides insulae]
MTMSTTGVASLSTPTTRPPVTERLFPWVVFALTFGLLLSDHMSRQVLSAIFPFLEAEWGLTNTQLGSLTSVVALAAGALAVPLSILGDRFGRVRAILLMGTVWSVATLGCALAAGYGQLMMARVLLGVGEAAFGSVGLAVVLAVFPPHRRAVFTGSFMAGSVFGAVVGVALGGIAAERLGWRASFVVMAVIGLMLVVLYRVLITEERLERHRQESDEPAAVTAVRPPLSTLFSTPAVILAYAASGIQLFAAGTLYSWLPTYLHRTYDLPVERAAVVGSGFFMLMGVGMIVCGALTDRLSFALPIRTWTIALLYSAITLVMLGLSFLQEPGAVQMALLGVGAFFSAGTAGPAGAMVARLTPEPIRATAMGTLTLANNLLGLAAGPFVIGVLADRFGLDVAFFALPVACAVSAILFWAGRCSYPAALAKVQARVEEARA